MSGDWPQRNAAHTIPPGCIGIVHPSPSHPRGGEVRFFKWRDPLTSYRGGVYPRSQRADLAGHHSGVPVQPGTSLRREHQHPGMLSAAVCVASRRMSYTVVAPTPGQVGLGAHTGGGAQDLPMPRLPYALPASRPNQHSQCAWSLGARPRPGCLGVAGYSCGAIESTAARG